MRTIRLDHRVRLVPRRQTPGRFHYSEQKQAQIDGIRIDASLAVPLQLFLSAACTSQTVRFLTYRRFQKIAYASPLSHRVEGKSSAGETTSMIAKRQYGYQVAGGASHGFLLCARTHDNDKTRPGNEETGSSNKRKEQKTSIPH